MEKETRPQSKLFGRRKGRPLHTRKRLLVETLLPELLFTLEKDGPTTPDAIFGPASSDAPLWMEIGFGNGEHLAEQAGKNPSVRFIGCEPFLNGVAGLLDHIDRDNLSNIRIFDNDARLVLAALPENALEKCFVLFADPWPKKRHTSRRFIGPESLDLLARAIKPNGLLRLASDHPSLIEWMRECLAIRPDFTCTYAHTTPPQDWVETRYQKKALAAGRTPFFMDYRRK